MRTIFMGIASLLTVAFLSQHASAAAAVQNRDMIAAEPGKAAIFVVRQPGKGDTVQAGVGLDGRNIVLQPGTFYRWDVDPGTHQVDTGITGAPDKITIQAEPGQTYFVRYTVIGNQSAASKNLTLVDDNQGRELVAQSSPQQMAVAPPTGAGGQLTRDGMRTLPGERSSAQGSATEGPRVGN